MASERLKSAYEVCFDGIVGPTHNYSGLSLGNVASTSHRALESNPLQAVLQGIEKMKSLSDLGLKQAVLPPQERPDISVLRRLGFNGSDKKILEEVGKQSGGTDLLSAVSSASSMWTANAATVSPSADTFDGRVHFTPANLIAKFHRSIEPATTALVLKKIFKNQNHFVHHDSLEGGVAFGDEGAANHTRLCSSYERKGIELFVFGRYGLRARGLEPKVFPARQTFEASEAIARNHGLSSDTTIFAQQNPDAIDAGVFHNDVVGVGNQNLYFYHEEAYVRTETVMNDLKKKYQSVCGKDLCLIQVPKSEVSLEDAVRSYLFNSQIVTLKPDHMTLIAPGECRESPRVTSYLKRLLDQGGHSIREVKYFDLRQSMRNGGGPACLRLRVVLTEKEIKATHSKVFMSDKLYKLLTVWAKKHYRESLTLDDLRDPLLLKESRTALDELTEILGLGSIYPFQKN